MKFENQYIIHFKGLKEGVHEFELNIAKSFFEHYGNLDVPDGNVAVQVVLNKESAFMELSLDLTGQIEVQCDRCLDYFSLPVHYEGSLVVRFSEIDHEDEDEIIYLHPEDNELDLSHYLYESITISIPIRKIHPYLPDGRPGCNPEMLERLKEHLV